MFKIRSQNWVVEIASRSFVSTNNEDVVNRLAQCEHFETITEVTDQYYVDDENIDPTPWTCVNNWTIFSSMSTEVGKFSGSHYLLFWVDSYLLWFFASGGGEVKMQMAITSRLIICQSVNLYFILFTSLFCMLCFVFFASGDHIKIDNWSLWWIW